jgi:hypothetical protein
MNRGSSLRDQKHRDQSLRVAETPSLVCRKEPPFKRDGQGNQTSQALLTPPYGCQGDRRKGWPTVIARGGASYRCPSPDRVLRNPIFLISDATCGGTSNCPRCRGSLFTRSPEGWNYVDGTGFSIRSAARWPVFGVS